MMFIKICTQCKESKSVSEFHKKKQKKDGVNPWCKDCCSIRSKESYSTDKNRDWSLKNLYGISLEDYNKLLDNQEGLCAICGTEENNGKAMSVDHCHTTGTIRGLLCNQCNRALGMFKDSPSLIIKAYNYLGGRFDN